MFRVFVLFILFLYLETEKDNFFSIILSWIFYFLIRIFLWYKFGLKTSTGGFDLKTMALNFNSTLISIWQTNEGGWILVISFFVYLFKHNFKSLFLFVAQVSIVFLISLLGFDVNRSLVYSYPVFIVSIIVLYPKIEIEKFMHYLRYSFLISFLYPAYCSSWTDNFWFPPFPIKMLFGFFIHA